MSDVTTSQGMPQTPETGRVEEQTLPETRQTGYGPADVLIPAQ